MSDKVGMGDKGGGSGPDVDVAGKPPLSPAAERALAEAAARRAERDTAAATTVPEVGGRSGPDPVRYGDWETGGIVSDF